TERNDPHPTLLSELAVLDSPVKLQVPRKSDRPEQDERDQHTERRDRERRVVLCDFELVGIDSGPDRRAPYDEVYGLKWEIRRRQHSRERQQKHQGNAVTLTHYALLGWAAPTALGRPDNAIRTSDLLVCAHGDERVHGDRTTHGHEARKGRDHHEGDGAHRVRQRVRLLHAVEHTPDHLRPRARGDEPYHRPDPGYQHPLRHHRPRGRATRRAKRHADPDLARALGD